MKLSLTLKCEGLFEYLTSLQKWIVELIIKVKMLCCIDVC